MGGTWEQPLLQLRAVMGMSMGDKASMWCCLPAVTLLKGRPAGGWLWHQPLQDICAQPAVGPHCGTIAAFSASTTPLCMGQGSKSQSLNSRTVLAPALPTMAWTQQGKLMNFHPGARAKQSYTLDSNFIAQPGSSVVAPASFRDEQKLELG